MVTATVHRTGRRLTAEGWLWLGIVGVLMTVSIAKNINLLALLTCLLLAVLLLSAIGAGRGLRRLEVRRAADEQIVAGMVSQVTIHLALPHGPALRGVVVEEVGQDHALAWYLDEVPPKADLVIVAEIVPKARGWYTFAPLAVVSRYPFGLVRRRLCFGEPLRLLALPRPGKLSRDRLRHYLRGADPRGDRVLRRGWRHETAQADFHGLRPFRAGDSPRWIHWRSSARRGELLVREFEDVPGDDLCVVVDPACPPGEAFEAVVSLAAAIVHAWCLHRGDHLVFALPGTPGVVIDGPTGPEHARDVLEALAVAAPSSAVGPDDAIEVAAGLGTQFGILVVSWGTEGLALAIERAVGRPVMHLDVARQREWEFYTPP